MKLSDFLPTSEQLASVQGIERQLIERRQRGTLLGVTFGILTAVVQVLLLVARAVPAQLPPFSWHGIVQAVLGPEGLVLLTIGFGAAAYFTARFTGVLFKESREVFRYTFYIEAFNRVDATPELRFPLGPDDPLKLLHYDLMERLNRRIQRLSLFNPPADSTDGKAAAGLTAHIHVSGDYALRQDKDHKWLLHIMPRVRMGGPGNPSTLAYPVRYPLEVDGDASPISPAQYEQMTERVYSRVATEIYKKIKADVERKFQLFPTRYLRGVACYCEARDFEKSSTIDAYNQALELYGSSLDELEGRAFGGLRNWLSRRTWARRWMRRSLEAEALVRLGYSRCMIFRRLVSELSGRRRDPLFPIRDQLKQARDLLQQCYDRLAPPANRNAGPLEGRGIQKSIYAQLHEEICEAYAVSALGYANLDDAEKAREFLGKAEEWEDQRDTNRSLLLVAKAELTDDLAGKIAHLRRALESQPDSEIARFRLAVALDLQARQKDEITSARVKVLTQAYEAVLKINPANIASLIGQGYLSWLVRDFDGASKIFRAGNELQEIAQTFLGDLKYGEARVVAEQAASTVVAMPETPSNEVLKAAAQHVDQAVRTYEEAMAADPAVAAFVGGSHFMVSAGYYAGISPRMLERYGQFAGCVAKAHARGDELKLAPGLIQALEVLLSYALNDYGNACLNHYLRSSHFGVPGDDETVLEKAIENLTSAVAHGRQNATAQYNLSAAYSYSSKEGATEMRAHCLDQAVKLFPYWLDSAMEQSTISVGKYQYDPANLAVAFARGLPAIVGNTRLSPWRECLEVRAGGSLQKLQDLLANPKIGWSRFGDAEVAALGAWADVLGSIGSTEPGDARSVFLEASRLLYQHILEQYSPEYFNAIRGLIYDILKAPGRTREDEDELPRLEQRLLRVLADAETKDPTSAYYPYLRSDYLSSSAYFTYTVPARAAGQADKYDEAIPLFEKAIQKCPDAHYFYFDLADALEKKADASEKDATAPGKAARDALRSRAAAQFEEALKRNPEDPEYRARLLTAQSRAWVGSKLLADDLQQLPLSYLLEVRISPRSLPDMLEDIEANGLNARLKERIAGVRSRMEHDEGVTLPGVTFRDDASIAPDLYRIYIRDVPVGELNATGHPREEKWNLLVAEIERIARVHRVEYFGPQEAIYSIRKLERERKVDYSKEKEDPDWIAAFTVTIKGLLQEEVPLSDLEPVLSTFQTGQSQGWDLVRTSEEIRSALRTRLPGNDPAKPCVILRLSEDLERQIEDSVDRSGPEPVFHSKPSTTLELARALLKATDGRQQAALLASSEIRPFVRRLTEGAAAPLPVLSTREIMPAMIARLEDEIG